jgi:hypothetical protein
MIPESFKDDLEYIVSLLPASAYTCDSAGKLKKEVCVV